MISYTQRMGLSGGIGSGKSTATAMLGEAGACVIDADAISRATTAPDGSAIAAIEQHFGPSFIAADGGLNRDEMRDLIFTDNEAKHRLENIVHPLIQIEMQRQFQLAVSKQAKLVVYDIPLLVESKHWRQIVDQILIVDCLPETQINRVMRRNALKREVVEKIIANQASREQRLKAADIVIFNESINISQLRDELMLVARIYGL
jgi:dephospho-CoA kinase